ncbi:MAG: aminopeptidase N [Mariprofundaceae bacterium]|nr:aminopeptidase N [Mariprofundaceae bacterium]
MNLAETIYLKDYQPADFAVEDVHLDFTLQPDDTRVVSTVRYRRQTHAKPDAPLVLNGKDLVLLEVQVDGQTLNSTDYHQDDEHLTIHAVPDAFTLAVNTRIAPQQNTALEGLYRSSAMYCTQCEAQGFRRITYYLDRPDVMAPFTVRIVAEQASNPVLLSNGNPVGHGCNDDGTHWAAWHDPYPKPCYLFALVAGDLASVEDHYRTRSGRDVTLKIFTEAHHIDACAHAMASLKRAMAWDEQRFGLEYDLDLFMIVAVDDFNMGAMENKGLNVFNAKLVFASPQTATDEDYLAIEAVIGHEYFHNWTGNRVTCRDWFQLSLKEGLTVFRDQEFTADLHSRTLKRIEDVRLLRSYQFREDASPMAHPIRPASFVEINNFYTVTVYEKGAEVVRLYHTLLGKEGFRRGMDTYIQRHDGQAVTTEDFLAAMADANDADLTGMQAWYDQAGTPHLSVTMHYDAVQKQCTLHCKQTQPAEAGDDAKPLWIPLTLALFLPDGQATPLQLLGEDTAHESARTVVLKTWEQSFTFEHINAAPTPSLLRGFSAPVVLDYHYSNDDLAFLMRYDDDGFNRWDATWQLAMRIMVARVNGEQVDSSVFTHALARLLQDDDLEAAIKAEALTLPSENDVAGQLSPVDPARIHAVREQLRTEIAQALHEAKLALYQSWQYVTGTDDTAMQQRALKHACLGYLPYSDPSKGIALAYEQFCQSTTMTDQAAALNLLTHYDCPQRKQALHAFEQRWQDDANVMNKWFTLQAKSTLPDTLQRVESLMQHPAFDLRNPNKVRSLIGTVTSRNPAVFHAVDGAGYRFLAAQVIALDAINPQQAARMVRGFMLWKTLEPTRRQLMLEALQSIATHTPLSSDVQEIVTRSLKG